MKIILVVQASKTVELLSRQVSFQSQQLATQAGLSAFLSVSPKHRWALHQDVSPLKYTQRQRGYQLLWSSMHRPAEQASSNHFVTAGGQWEIRKVKRRVSWWNNLTKSIVATSLAVVKWGRPALGLGNLATISCPLSIVSRKTLLYWPSEVFRTRAQDCAATTEAAMPRSSWSSNLT